MNILDALDDSRVFGLHFKGPTWAAWRVFLASLFALPMMTEEQLAIYRKHTGRSTPPTQPLHEAWLCCGRRSGKSFILACIAIFIACFRDWRPHLAPGERAVVMIIAADRRQARVIMRYCLGLLKSVPMLAQLIEGETRESVSLRNRIVIEVHTASFRSTRGYTIIAALLDEVAYWPTDESSAEPDIEVINAVRPGMATIADAMLLCASSPHARKGALWSAYAKHYAKDGDPILVWRADTRSMNSTVPQSYIDAHMADDAARASAEYLAEFRSDLEAYVSREVVELCISDYFEMAPAGSTSYYGFTDPSGGSDDLFTMAVSHRDGERVVIDCIREVRPPFSPEAVIIEFASVLKNYRCHRVSGDRFGGEFPREQFRKRGITYDVSERVKSEIYRDFLPLLNSGRVILPRNERLMRQLCSLERTTARGSGRDNIDHPSGGHDDVANCVAGASRDLRRWCRL